MTVYILFLIGFVILIKGADWFIDGAASIAKRFGLSSLFIGLTIIAFGTSAPELFVNVMASFRGSGDIAVGNIIGSNIANILLILGVAAVIRPLRVRSNTIHKEIPLSLLATVVVAIMLNDMVLDQWATSLLSRSEGLVLVSFFLIFLYYTFGISQSSGDDDMVVKSQGMTQSLLMIGLGLTGLVIGGAWIVDGAIAIARTFGLQESLIGLTIVAVGTSLPELATSAVAAYRGKADIAIGNVVGSNIFNIFWILGISATITPLSFSPVLNQDVAMAIATTILLFLAFFIGRRHELERWQGYSFIALYFVYLAYLVQRG